MNEQGKNWGEFKTTVGINFFCVKNLIGNYEFY